MSIQGILNQQALELLPRVYEQIQNEKEQFNRDQMRHAALREIMNSYKPVAEMDETERSTFEQDLLTSFKEKGWLDYDAWAKKNGIN